MPVSTSDVIVVSSVPDLRVFLSSIPPSSTLYFDLEGNRLSRHGTITLITILVHPHDVLWLIDVIAIGKGTFTVALSDGRSLKSILEDPDIPKYIWDVRNDADALWALYQVGIKGVTDIQLLENVSRAGDKTYVHGLDKTVQSDLKLGFMELHRWMRTKREVKTLMATDIFSTRPMDSKTTQYCVNDVIHLPALHALYLKGIGRDSLLRVKEESARRVDEAHSPGYEPLSRNKTLGPWGSGIGKRPTFEDVLEELEDQRIDRFAAEIFGHDDFLSYYSYDDEGGTNAADGAFYPEVFDSCWDKSL
ncbi:3-5 exonuclease [Pleurostoma richardsiae]|uniref:3-5 exonuclease n=1 Tax=Pleurostoma richardsiae TaxID=41990 RepID=A0AA38R7H1_9PEZI|nr:3-5 exonuclease [Pleurostoma richardsiae]